LTGSAGLSRGLSRVSNRRRRIIFAHYGNAAMYPPLEHAAKILSERGWEILFITAPAAGPAHFELAPMPGVRSVPRRAGRFAFSHLRYLAFGVRLLGWSIRWRPSWIYVSDPPACWPTTIARWVARAHIAYHEHDTPSPATSFREKIIWRGRGRLVRSSDVVIFPNERRADLSGLELHNASVMTVRNCPLTDEVGPPQPPLRSGLKILFHGSLVPERLPPTTIEALAQLPDNVVLRVAGYETIGHGGYVADLRETAAKLGVADRFKFVGSKPLRSELLDFARSCDVGLALVPKGHADVNMRTMEGASNKPFDYLASGLPVLVTDIEPWTEMFVGSRLGRSCDPDDPKSIASSLRWFLENPKETREMGEKGRTRVLQEWNYENEFGPVVDALEKAEP
jgi:glycosyltransferase involved in cell wall biosynthesis